MRKDAKISDTTQDTISSKTKTDEKDEWIEKSRIKLKKLMSTTWQGSAYTTSLIVLSVISCLEYVYQTFIEDPFLKNCLDIYEMANSVIFCFDWVYSLFLADHKSEFLCSFFSIVDILTVKYRVLYLLFIFPHYILVLKVIPIWFTRGTTCPVFKNIDTLWARILYILYALQTTRVLRALRVMRYLDSIEDEVHRSIVRLVLTVFVMLIFDASLMQFLEQDKINRPFNDWIYYMWVTVATVGYGDISPVTTKGRAAAMVFIVVAIITVPQMSNNVLETMVKNAIYARARFRPRENSTHIVICGDLHSTSLREFFSELFHEDHENVNLHAVLLQPAAKPNFDMLSNILNDPIFSLCVTYLEGSAMSERDLKRAHIDKAKAVFLMANKFHENADEQDAKTILEHVSIKRFISRHVLDPKILFCMQLIRPENRRHLNENVEREEDLDLVICINQIKMGLLAKTVTYPGTSTLLFNLICSFTESDLGDVNNPEQAVTGDAIDELKEDDKDRPWLREYQQGCGWEIYSSDIADELVGLEFNVLALQLYLISNILLFGLQLTDLRGKGQCRIILNPADCCIPSKEDFDIKALIIAENKQQSILTISVDPNFNASEGKI